MFHGIDLPPLREAYQDLNRLLIHWPSLPVTSSRIPPESHPLAFTPVTRDDLSSRRVTPTIRSAQSIMGFLRETMMNWAFPESSFTMVAICSTLYPSRNMSISSRA